jgi:hypothetical protein
VHLDAAPAAGMQFAGWSGACSGQAGCDLTIEQDTQVGALFAPGTVPMVTITVNPVGSGAGRVTSSPVGLECPGSCAMQVASGSAVTLTAVADGNSHFEGFGGGCNGLTCALVASATTTVYANFSAITVPPAGDPCAGLVPKLPAAKTFLSPGNAIDGSCGFATTDGAGNVYAAHNANGGGIFISTGGTVGGQNFLFPLASGFVGFERKMTASGPATAFAPDGTVTSATGAVVPFVIGEVANGGSIIIGNAQPAAADCSGFELLLFDDDFKQTATLPFGDLCALPLGAMQVATVDARNRILVVSSVDAGNSAAIPASRYAARWFDIAGKPLTEWFDGGPASSSFFSLRPLIGGGAALLAGSEWTVSFPSGVAGTGPVPAGFEGKKDARIVLGGKAYAMVPQRAAGSVDVVEPGGKTCGSLTATDSFYALGKDGTLLTMANTEGPDGRIDQCTTTYYPHALK